MSRLHALQLMLLVLEGVAIVAVSAASEAGQNKNSSAVAVPVGGRTNDRSTSSSSGEKDKKKDYEAESKDADSLNIIESGSGTSSSEEDRYKKWIPKSSAERHGWRKYHRKCEKCEELKKKWREPSIGWLCGGYQRARRTFKSKCMMRYRNCQDGTMFVKIHSGRCKNNSQLYGEHFLYDYKVTLSEDSTDTDSEDSSSSTDSSEDSY